MAWFTRLKPSLWLFEDVGTQIGWKDDSDLGHVGSRRNGEGELLEGLTDFADGLSVRGKCQFQAEGI